MNSLLKQVLLEWNSEKNQRIKMQQAYFTIVIIAAGISGMLSFLNYSLSQTILAGAAFMAGAYVINAVSWFFINDVAKPKIDKLVKHNGSKKPK